MNHSLVPIVGEDYYNLTGLQGASYKAVAVVKKSNSDITFLNLKGKTSCHTGAGKTAGWNVPIGTLLRMKIMEQDKSCNAYVSAGKFFNESCVPSKFVYFDWKIFYIEMRCALSESSILFSHEDKYLVW